jgi:hypothetical protein
MTWGPVGKRIEVSNCGQFIYFFLIPKEGDPTDMGPAKWLVLLNINTLEEVSI